MLLRSSSAPISSSFLPHAMEYSSSSPEAELVLQLPRTVASPRQNWAETDHLQTPSKIEKKKCVARSNVVKNQQTIKVKESDEVEEPQQNIYKKATPSVRELFSSSGLDKQVPDHEEGGAGKKVSKLQTLVMGGGMGSDGGRICGGYNGSGRGSDDEHGSGWESDHGRDGTDAYYQNMIEANPNNALLLGNYARFLKEVRADYPKAEEYLERAILANPSDANLLSLYADLIWQTQKNADRAEGYFDQAVKSSPDDCYVLASYAKFLWDVEEDEDKDCQHKADQSYTYPSDLFQGTNGRHHVTAAS